MFQLTEACKRPELGRERVSYLSCSFTLIDAVGENRKKRREGGVG